jgi:hypothetical protein
VIEPKHPDVSDSGVPARRSRYRLDSGSTSLA